MKYCLGGCGINDILYRGGAILTLAALQNSLKHNIIWPDFYPPYFLLGGVRPQ